MNSEYLPRNMNLRRFERQDAAVPGSDSDPTNFFDDSDGSEIYSFVTEHSPTAQTSNPNSPPMYVDEQDFSIVVYDRMWEYFGRPPYNSPPLRVLSDEEADANTPVPETEETLIEPQVENQSVSGSTDNQQASPNLRPLSTSSSGSPLPSAGLKRSSSANSDDTDDERYSTIALRVKRRRKRLQNIDNVDPSIVPRETASSDIVTSNLPNFRESVDANPPPVTSVAPAISDDNSSSNSSADPANYLTANTSFEGVDTNLDKSSGSSNDNDSSSLTNVLVIASAATATFSDNSGSNTSSNDGSVTAPVSFATELATVVVTEEGSNLASTESSNLASDEASNSSSESSQTSESVFERIVDVGQSTANASTDSNNDGLAADANGSLSPATESATNDGDRSSVAHVSVVDDA